MQKTLLLLSFIFIFSNTQAQKKPLDHSVYDAWQTIGSSTVSKDGKWIAYTVTPQEGDGKLVLSNAKAEALIEIQRGTNATFTTTSQHLISLIKAPFSETRMAKIKKKKTEDMPGDSLAIFTIGKKHLFKTANVKSFKLAKHDASFLAYLQKAIPDSAMGDTSDKKDKKSDLKPLYDLVLHNLSSGESKSFKNIEDYDFNESGDALYFVQKSVDSTANDAGLYLYTLSTQSVNKISTGKGEYKNISFDKDGKQLAFTAYKGSDKNLSKIFQLYYYQPNADTAVILNNGLAAQWAVSEHGQVRFSENGEKLFFGIAPILPVKDTTLVDFETAKLDIWHWQDDYLQPQQLVNLKRDLAVHYLGVLYPKDPHARIIPLSDEALPSTTITKNGNAEYVLAITDMDRRIATQWQPGAFQDAYIVSTKDGQRTKIASNVRGSFSFSPEGNYVIWFDRSDSNWYSYAVSSGQTRLLNQGLSVRFSDEDNDVPNEPSAYGIAAWAEQDERVFIYDKYDIWSFDPDGKVAKNITNGKGRKENLTYRYLDLDDTPLFSRSGNKEALALNKVIYLHVFDHQTKENGIAKVHPKNGTGLTMLTKGPFTYRQIKASENLKTVIYTKENYLQSPDLYVSPDFIKETPLSKINQQQQNYLWGTAELVAWKTPNGHAAEGIFYKPENFDPSKKYPMISYFYEILSDGLYRYIPPEPTPSRLNISYFVSNGYLVFAPDIHYKDGYPGKSAEEYINSGVEYLKTHPYVDAAHIGIQGQSWGGYQVAHLITRTDMYAAAWAGAPVVNMTSAYGGIRWQSGMSRQFQYERTQSRIGKTLWEDLDLYIENSPLFHLPKVNTPVVIMANDEDGAVPWYQGIEMFTALRRLQKPVWLLNYNGDAHNLVERKNRKDIQIREQQFFDHYLKGKPSPVWLDRGVPATSKGIDWGLELLK